MAPRRLAEDSIQPPSFAFTAENLAWAEQVIARYPAGRQASAVIPILWRAQEQQGWVTRAAIEAVARMLDMAYIRVLEVATFYTQFLLKPVGANAHVIVCGTTPCMLRGAGELLEVCRHNIAHDPLEVSADGKLSWEEGECLGACVNAPMILIGNDTYEDLTTGRFEEIVEAFRAGKGDSIPVGPQIKRQFSAAEGGATTLLETPTAERTYKPFPPPAPPAAPAAAVAAPTVGASKPLPAGDPPAPEPTNKGRGAETAEESAPALMEPKGGPKVSVAKAEGERKAADAAAHADGQPNRAMREEATRAESLAGKIGGGKAVRQVRKLFEAPTGAADDLKLISGVGPVLEATLNAIGITTWKQVAGLTPEQIDAVEAEAGFKGRITRDNWLKQADALARGGVDEYVRVFGKKPK